MSLVALDGTPLVAIGGINTENRQAQASAVQTLCDAANEACIMIGQVFTEDGASHTVNTSGSSSLGWRTGSVTFANGGTTVKVGIAAVDTANGPAARAANAADVITFDVSKSLTGGGGGITANAWQEHVPDTGTKTIAHGDLVAFCVQMTAVAGGDLVNATTGSTVFGPVRPSVTNFTGGSYSLSTSVPNVVITFSDGTLGFFYGSMVFTTVTTTQTWNNTSGTKEYGNFFQMPVAGKVYGFVMNLSAAGDCDAILYSDPLGTPVAEKTASFDLNAVGVASTGRWTIAMFSSPYTFTANQPLAGIMKPTSASNVASTYLTFNASAHQKSLTLGANCYAVNRASGAFAAQNSNKDRFALGLLVGAFDAGGSTGLSRSRAFAGFS